MALKIIPAKGQTRNLGTTTTAKTAATMRVVILDVQNTPEVLNLVNFVRYLMASGFPLVPALAYMAYKNAYYYPDENAQTIRTPARVVSDRLANCVDYTVMICAVALHFEPIKNVQFQLGAYLPGGDYTHVYPIIAGQIIDVVPVQLQDGKERFCRPLNFFPTLAALNGSNLEPVKVQTVDL